MQGAPENPRPLTRAQRQENKAFLAELRRTGNAREAARRLGAHRAKFTRRRAKHPAFAAEWDAALAFADAQVGKAAPHLVRRANGRLQLRAAPAGGLDPAARTRFLAALAASANVRLAAKAAGFSHAAFYHHKRRDPDFAREWRAALATGYGRLEAALLEGWSDDDALVDWRRNELPAIPPMSPAQALQLMYLHMKEARLRQKPPEHLRRRAGESHLQLCQRLDRVEEDRRQQQREREEEIERLGRALPDTPPGPHEPAPPVLPDLAQVTGWSKASGKPAHDPDRALFGGWRLPRSWDGSY